MRVIPVADREVGKMAVATESEYWTTRAAAEAYVGGVCFKVGPPGLIGAELEWLTVCADGDCSRPSPAQLAAALGPYAPCTIAASSPGRPLPGGSYVTIEPGGQIEISSLPFASADALSAALDDDAEFLHLLLARNRIATVAVAADTRRPAKRILEAPRYRAMEALFDSISPFGRLMMCNTAATQVSIDAGVDAADVAVRWRAANAIGPALLAAFACSRALFGAPDGVWASQRMRAWLHLDGSRTAVPAGADPVTAYARWALDVPLLCVRGEPGTDWTAPRGATFGDWIDGALDDVLGRRPGAADLDYHLTTLFPPVRARGHFELRYLDAQPADGWKAPVAVVDSLFADTETAAQATRLAAAAEGRWRDAARHGLADPAIRCAAVDVLELAADRVRMPDAKGLVLAAVDRCRSGEAPTEENIR